MAARLRLNHQEDVKAKIRIGQLIERLQNHVDGVVELSTTQIQAARILLDKSLSNAPTAIEGGDPSRPIVVALRDAREEPDDAA